MLTLKFPGGSPDSWAPNFALSKERLKPGWIEQWIIDPQSLLPGTKMPNYFDPQAFELSGPDDILDGNEHEQIRVLRNYLLTLSEEVKVKKPTKVKQLPPKSTAETPLVSPVLTDN